jgi:rhomboid family GlyGly-CTERM serine protease
VARGVRLSGGRAVAWAALGAVLAVGALVGALAPTSALDWQPTRAWREPWRWWSAAFVHWSTMHLAVNVLGAAVVVAWGWAARVPVRGALAWAAAWPLTHLALLAQPRLAHYGGLSGVLHAGVAVAAVWLSVRERGARRALGAAVLVGLTLKVALEAPWRGTLQVLPPWDFAVAPLAHAAGAAAGALLGAWAARPSRRAH